MESETEEAMLTFVKSSDVREQILRELYLRTDERVRPSKILEAIEDEMTTSSGNFYMNLDKLREEGMVDKMDSESRATLYRLTDKGTAVADALKDEWERRGELAADDRVRDPSNSATDRMVETSDPPSVDEVDPELVDELRGFLAKIPYTPDEVIRAAEQIKRQ
jgi:DNA-binding PadR family transcriptional regulator